MGWDPMFSRVNLVGAASVVAAVVATLATTAAAPAATALTIHITGVVEGHGSERCFLLLAGARIATGGTETYCLERFTGRPGPNATVRDSGVMTFALPRGSIRARVAIVQRFAADGAHARQTLSGTVTGGTRGYAGARGTIRGGGRVVERLPGHLASSDLTYVLMLR